MGGDTYDGGSYQNGLQLPGLMDLVWGNGYKNDVWSMQGTDWTVKGDVRIRTQFHQKLPKTTSQLVWKEETSGLQPHPGQTYDDYLICQDSFANVAKLAARRAVECINVTAVQWSPRRDHASVYHNGLLWVMGGRAREFVELPEIRSIGGIIGPRVKDYRAPNQKYSTQR